MLEDGRLAGDVQEPYFLLYVSSVVGALLSAEGLVSGKICSSREWVGECLRDKQSLNECAIEIW